MQEPQRLQYLQAMGLTAWVGRYRLPNAAETDVCAWPEEESETQAPSSRLQEALATTSHPVASSTVSDPPARRSGRARALLGTEDSEASGSPVALNESSASDRASLAEDTVENDGRVPLQTDSAYGVPQALRFSLHVAALEGRWLVVMPGGESPSPLMQRLLSNVLRAAGIEQGGSLAFQSFHWPMIDELPVHAPLEEAQDGVRAFIDGRRRSGWRLERLLLFGGEPVLDQVLSLADGHCTLLDIPAWQGPSLETLAYDPAGKRSLVPMLSRWREQWFRAADG